MPICRAETALFSAGVVPLGDADLRTDIIVQRLKLIVEGCARIPCQPCGAVDHRHAFLADGPRRFELFQIAFFIKGSHICSIRLRPLTISPIFPAE